MTFDVHEVEEKKTFAGLLSSLIVFTGVRAASAAIITVAWNYGIVPYYPGLSIVSFWTVLAAIFIFKYVRNTLF